MIIRRIVFALVLTTLIALPFGGPALAEHQAPAGSCPSQFELHHYMDPTDPEHEHMHTGLASDTNSDGYICVKHTLSGKHVHVDNYLP